MIQHKLKLNLKVMGQNNFYINILHVTYRVYVGYIVMMSTEEQH